MILLCIWTVWKRQRNPGSVPWSNAWEIRLTMYFSYLDYQTMTRRSTTPWRTNVQLNFIKRSNTIHVFESVKFNQWRQEEGKSLSAFITAFYCLSKYCGYGALRKRRIRDWIVVRLLRCGTIRKAPAWSRNLPWKSKHTSKSVKQWSSSKPWREMTWESQSLMRQ